MTDLEKAITRLALVCDRIEINTNETDNPKKYSVYVVYKDADYARVAIYGYGASLTEALEDASTRLNKELESRVTALGDQLVELEVMQDKLRKAADKLDVV